MNLDAARTLLAGWLAGAVVGLGDTALLLVILALHPGWATRLPAFRIRLSFVGMFVANGMVIGWTLVGLLMGALLLKVPMPAFAAVVAAIWIGLGGVHGFLRGRTSRDEMLAVWVTVTLAVLAFAGGLPLLASTR